MVPHYQLRLMFEWGGGCLWSGNDAVLHRFGYGPLDEILPITAATRGRLGELSIWHDRSLNWEYPPDPGPWDEDERERFNSEALGILQTIRSELGPEFVVEYTVL
jgi:hypothetical protein